MLFSRTYRVASCVLVLSLAICLVAGRKNSPGDETPPPKSNANDVHVVSNGFCWAVGDSGMVLRRSQCESGDGEWEEVTVAGIEQGEWDFHGVFCADSEHVWVVGNRNREPRSGLGIIVSTMDGGKNWCSLFPSPPGGETLTVEFMDIHFENRDCGWIRAGKGYVLVTIDRGNTWVWSREK